jgi:hypothetical protein
MWLRERSGRALQGSMNFSKCQARASQPGLEVFILPLPVNSHYVKKCVPRGLSVMPSQTVRVWIPTVKTRSQWLLEWPVGLGGLSARTPRNFLLGRRTVCGKAVDRPPGPPELHTVLSSFEVNYGPSAVDPRTVHSEAIFLEKLCQKC